MSRLALALLLLAVPASAHDFFVTRAGGVSELVGAPLTCTDGYGVLASSNVATCTDVATQAELDAYVPTYWLDPVLTFGSLPTCNAGRLGRTSQVATAGGGNEYTLAVTYICAKTSLNTYYWAPTTQTRLDQGDSFAALTDSGTGDFDLSLDGAAVIQTTAADMYLLDNVHVTAAGAVTATAFDIGGVDVCLSDGTDCPASTDDQTATEVPYTPTTGGDWSDPDPTDVGGALDALAAAGGASSSGTGLQYGDGAGGFSEVTGSSVSGADVTLVNSTASSEGILWIKEGVGSGGSPQNSVSQLVVDSATHAGVNFLAATSGTVDLSFGDSSDANAGVIQYSNATNALSIRTNSTGLQSLVIDSSQRVGVNDSSPDAQLDVVSGSASRVGVIVEGASAQTANLIEANTNGTSGGTAFKVDASGGVTVGDIFKMTPKATAPATCTAAVDIYMDTSGAFCVCTSTNTWTNTTGVGSCA